MRAADQNFEVAPHRLEDNDEQLEKGIITLATYIDNILSHYFKVETPESDEKHVPDMNFLHGCTENLANPIRAAVLQYVEYHDFHGFRPFNNTSALRRILHVVCTIFDDRTDAKSTLSPNHDSILRDLITGSERSYLSEEPTLLVQLLIVISYQRNDMGALECILSTASPRVLRDILYHTPGAPESMITHVATCSPHYELWKTLLSFGWQQRRQGSELYCQSTLRNLLQIVLMASMETGEQRNLLDVLIQLHSTIDYDLLKEGFKNGCAAVTLRHLLNVHQRNHGDIPSSCCAELELPLDFLATLLDEEIQMEIARDTIVQKANHCSKGGSSDSGYVSGYQDQHSEKGAGIVQYFEHEGVSRLPYYSPIKQENLQTLQKSASMRAGKGDEDGLVATTVSVPEYGIKTTQRATETQVKPKRNLISQDVKYCNIDNRGLCDSGVRYKMGSLQFTSIQGVAQHVSKREMPRRAEGVLFQSASSEILFPKTFQLELDDESRSFAMYLASLGTLTDTTREIFVPCLPEVCGRGG